MKALDRGIARIETLLALVAGFGLVAVVVLITADVVGRNLHLISLPWTVELSQYWLIAGTFLAAGWIYREGAHPRISLVDALANARLRTVLRVVATLIAVSAATFGLVFMLEIIAVQIQRGTDVGTFLRIPRWIVLSPVAIGFFFLLYEAIRTAFPGDRASTQAIEEV